MFKKSREKSLHVLTFLFKGPKAGPCGSTRAAVAVASVLRKCPRCQGASVFPGKRGHDLVVEARFKSAEALERGFRGASQALLIEEARAHLKCAVHVERGCGYGYESETLKFELKLADWGKLTSQQKIHLIERVFADCKKSVTIEVEVSQNVTNARLPIGGEYLHMALSSKFEAMGDLKEMQHWSSETGQDLVLADVEGLNVARGMDSIADFLSHFEQRRAYVHYKVEDIAEESSVFVVEVPSLLKSYAKPEYADALVA